MLPPQLALKQFFGVSRGLSVCGRKTKFNFLSPEQSTFFHTGDGAEPEFGIQKGTNNMIFTNTDFKQLLKLFVFRNKKNIYQKAVFSNETAVHVS